MEQSPTFADRLARKLESIQFFTEREAWDYFRIAAFGEAIGWTLLISGIAIRLYITPGNNTAVDIAGQIHGTIFLVYIVAVVVLCASLKWSRKQTVIAALASIPPYGTLVFEQYMAHKRHREARKSHRQIVVRAIIVKQHTILAVQPKDSGFWCLPGGRLREGESTEQALVRTLFQQTGVTPKIGRLLYVFQYKHRGTDRIEFFFVITNVTDYSGKLRPLPTGQQELDEMEFIDPNTTTELEPKFLTTHTVIKAARQKTGSTSFITN